MKKAIALLSIFLCFVSLFAATYTIDSYSFNISGRTREEVLRRAVSNDEGISFSSVEELEKALFDKTQILLDKRIFRGVTATWKEIETIDDIVHIEAIFDIIGSISGYVSPGGSFDSNYGLRLLLSGVDQNFLGSMKETSLLLDIRQQDLSFEKFIFKICAKSNIHIAGVDNLLHFDLHLNTKNNEESFSILSLASKAKSFSNVLSFTFLFSPTEGQDRAGLTNNLSIPLTSKIGLGLSYQKSSSSKTGLSLSYSFFNSSSFSLSLTGNSSQHWNKAQFKGFENSIKLSSTGRSIQWYSDFRKGYDFKASLTLNDKPSVAFDLEGMAYFIPTPWMNIHTRLIGHYSEILDIEKNKEFTTYVRGVRDDNAILGKGTFTAGFVVNASALCHVLSITKLGKFYINPFVDMCLVFDSKWQLLGGIGCELFAVLDQWPGLPFRLSFGQSLRDMEEWELAVNASFFY